MANNEEKRMIGLAYLDSFAEIRQWNEKDVDPLQKSNTPFLKRPDVVPSQNPTKSSNVIAYARLQEWVSGKRWQRVHAFNYFTHHRVSIPPATWINTGHRNGALVLGTFTVESGEPRRKAAPESSFMLDEKPEGTYVLADKLYRIAACYGFDGWLLNIETTIAVGDEDWKGGKALELMISQLKTKLSKLPSGGMLLWYDAVTKDNQGNFLWQNTLNESNVGFAKSAGAFVTNYSWNKKYLDEAKTVADRMEKVADSKEDVSLKPEALYFGTDCWAQTDDGDDPNTRQTYGESEPGGRGKDENDFNTGNGHGGLATGLGVKPLPGFGMGAGIFAPAWAYEHFAGARDVDRFMWEGTPDLSSIRDLRCGCHFGVRQHMRPDFQENPIAKFATRFPAGSEGFFHTDYQEPIVQLSFGKYFAHLGQQSILPPPAERTAPLNTTQPAGEFGTMLIQLASSPSRCSIYISPKTAWSSVREGTQVNGKLTLHKINARADLGLEVTIKYQTTPGITGLTFSVFAEVGKGVDKPLPAEPSRQTVQVLPIPNTKDRVTSIGITIQGSVQGVAGLVRSGMINVLDLLEVTLKPAQLSYSKNTISDVKIEKRGTIQRSIHHRLVWSIPSTKPTPASPLPWSELTGPYSHFVVSADNKELGRAYATEFVLEEGLYKVWTQVEPKKNPLDVVIQGYAFDGTEIGRFSDKVSLA